MESWLRFLNDGQPTVMSRYSLRYTPLDSMIMTQSIQLFTVTTRRPLLWLDFPYDTACALEDVGVRYKARPNCMLQLKWETHHTHYNTSLMQCYVCLPRYDNGASYLRTFKPNTKSVSDLNYFMRHLSVMTGWHVVDASYHPLQSFFSEPPPATTSPSHSTGAHRTLEAVFEQQVIIYQLMRTNIVSCLFITWYGIFTCVKHRVYQVIVSIIWDIRHPHYSSQEAILLR